MTPQEHRFKAERIEQSLSKLRGCDVEIQIEAAMLAGTHWVNFVLHRIGVSHTDEDMVHASMSMVSTLRKYKLAEPQLIESLECIEELRPLFVRGDVSGGSVAVQQALLSLHTIKARARALF